jgi:tRNA dimethylallyltransferase
MVIVMLSISLLLYSATSSLALSSRKFPFSRASSFAYLSPSSSSKLKMEASTESGSLSTSVPNMHEQESVATMPEKKKIIVLAGATSTGKSKVAMELAIQNDYEIIIGDSVQVYQGLNIGSTKPTIEEQSRIRHHLIDIANPADNEMNTGRFFALALAAIQDIHTRGKIPLIVGGATMWLQWLVHGKRDAPQKSEMAAALASSLTTEYEQLGDWENGINILREYDPERANQLQRNDWYRLKRSLEIAIDLQGHIQSIQSTSSTTTSSSISITHSTEATTTNSTMLDPEIYDLRLIFLMEKQKEQLYRIIDSRCLTILKLGLIPEIGNLLLTSDALSNPDSPATKAIGYRQTILYLLQPPNYHANSNTNSSTSVNNPVKSDLELFQDYIK